MKKQKTIKEEVFKSTNDRHVFTQAVRWISKLTQTDTTFVTSKSRIRDVVLARHALAYYMKKHTEFSLMYIGSMMGKDHATIIHSVNQIKDTAPFDMYIGTVKESIDTKTMPSHFTLREEIKNALKTYSTPNTRTEAILNIISTYEKQST